MATDRMVIPLRQDHVPGGKVQCSGLPSCARGNPCVPYDDGTLFFMRKVYTSKERPDMLPWMAEGTKERIGNISNVRIGLGLGSSVVIVVAFSVVKCGHSNPRKKYKHGTFADDFWK